MTQTDQAAPSGARFEWSADRIAMVKMIAENNGTAREAAEAVGLDPERDHVIYKLAKREGFKFKNLGRKRDCSGLFIRLDETPAKELTARALKRGEPRRELAAKLLNIVLQQGPTFIDNLLDDEA